MKKILTVVYAYEESGGTRTVIDNLNKYYTAQGHSTKNVVITYPETKNPTPGNVYLNKVESFNLLKTFTELNKIIEKEDPDRIFFILGHPLCAVLSTIMPLDYRRRSILYYLDPWFTFKQLQEDVREPIKEFIEVRKKIRDKMKSEDKVHKLFTVTKALNDIAGVDVYDKSIYKDFEGIVVCSSDMGVFFRELVSDQIPVLVNPLYYDKDEVVDVSTIERDNHLDLIFTGRVTSSWKGFGLVLKALQIIDNFTLSLYTWDTDEVIFAREFFRDYDLPLESLRTNVNSVTQDFLGHMSTASAVLIPSIAEGFSFTMLESMTRGGITVVGPKYGGPKDVIKHMHNGIRFNPGDYKDLAEKLELVRCMESDTELRIRNNARSSAKTYTFRKYIDRLNSVFKL